MIDHKEENFISAVVYLHNDENRIASFVKTITEILNKNFINCELICVDDGSYDNTLDQIKSVSDAFGKCSVSIVKLNNCQGYEAAMNAGVDLAIGDYVLEFDSAVMDYDPSLILELYYKTAEGFDVVSASDIKYKKISSRLFYSVFNKNANLQYTVQSESFRIVSRRAVNKVYSMGRSVRYRKALYANCGLKTARVFYEGKREYAKQKIQSIEQRADTAATSLIVFTNIAYKASLGISIFMMIATVLMAIYALITFITNHAIVGFTTTMLVMTGSFFTVFLIFAIVLKYLSVIVQMIFKKQEYMVESIEKISK